MFWLEKLDKTTKWLKKLWIGNWIDRFILISILLVILGSVFMVWSFVILNIVEINHLVNLPRKTPLR